MVRLAFGAGLLFAALATGFLAGNTGEDRVRATVIRVKDPVRTSERPRAVAPAADTKQPVERERDGGAVSAEAAPGESPEASDLVERMRRHLPDLADWQAEKIRRFHKGYKRKLRDNGLAVASVLEADPTTQLDAVLRMRELRRKRNEFLSSLLGRDKWERWRQIELTGGRDVDEFLRKLQGRNPHGESK